MTDWYDRRISPGTEWESTIASELEAAHVILLLISPAFMASRYCYDVELKRAMERHRAGEARVVPILLRPVDWEAAPFAGLQALPSTAEAVTVWPNKDAAFKDVAKGLRRILGEIRRSAAEASKQRYIVSTDSVRAVAQEQPTVGGVAVSDLDIRRVSTASKRRPLVSWLMVTTLTKHRWWKRLGEFLSERFPPDEVEFIILGAQDADFAAKAYEEGKKIASASAFLEGAEERWENVVFVGAYEPAFNLCRAQNILTSLARGEILIYRDADCMLLQYRFTEYLVKNLLRHKLGLLGVPSISDGAPFKPKESDITLQHSLFPGLLLDTMIGGMAVAVLASVERAVGGRNEHTPLLLYTNYCVKMARMGMAMAYAVDRGWWLATATDESAITRTDVVRDPSLLPLKQLSFGLLNKFYEIVPEDVFFSIQKSRYGVSADSLPDDILRDVERRFPAYAQAQMVEPSLERFSFKPWECLSHSSTDDYLRNAKEVIAPYADAALGKAREAGILLNY